MSIIQPLSLAQQQQVVDKTTAILQQLSELLGRTFAPIPISFNLRGRAAGMYRVKKGGREIRYNTAIFAKYFDDNLANTVPHEVAHYVIDCCYGRRVRPHGIEWQELMLRLDVEPSVTCQYDMGDIPQRRLRRFDYHCGCRTHQITTIRHNKIERGQASYLCKVCKKPLLAVTS